MSYQLFQWITPFMALMGVALPAMADPGTEGAIFLAGSADWLSTRATLRVPDRDPDRLAERGLRYADLHRARMIELTRFWCQEKPPEFTINWNYEAEGGKLFLGEFPITCQFAEQIFQAIGRGASERRTITQWRKDRREFVQTLNLETSAKVQQFLSLVKQLKPRCTVTLRCPGDRLDLANRIPILSPSASGCSGVLTAAKSRLEQVKGVSVERTDSTSIANLYQGFPPNRPMRYIFRLGGQGANQMVRSLSVLKQVSQDIMIKCDAVGSVTFSVLQNDELRTFGLVRGETVEEFKCIKSDPVEKLNWGYVLCL